VLLQRSRFAGKPVTAVDTRKRVSERYAGCGLKGAANKIACSGTRKVVIDD